MQPDKIHALEQAVPWIASHLSAGDRVLDVAGGAGVHASRLVRAAEVTVVGVDIAEGMVRQRLEDEKLPFNVVGDMEALPFPDGASTRRWRSRACTTSRIPQPALAEIFRVLRPGGRLFSQDPNSLRARGQGTMPVEGFEHEFRVSVGWLAEQMRRAGFAVEEIRGRNLTMRGGREGRALAVAAALPRGRCRRPRAAASCRASRG